MLISFLALIALANALLGAIGGVFQIDLSLQRIFGVLFMPLALLMGVSWKDAMTVGDLLGTRTVLNEFIAYSNLGAMKETLDPAFVHDRDLRAVRVCQLLVGRHADRGYRRARTRATARPGAPWTMGAACGHPCELPDGLHRRPAAVTPAAHPGCDRAGDGLPGPFTQNLPPTKVPKMVIGRASGDGFRPSFSSCSSRGGPLGQCFGPGRSP